MNGLTLQVEKRNVLGKKVRFLRQQGVTPAHLFGHGIDSLSLQSDTAKLRKIVTQAGTTRPIALQVEGDEEPRTVFIREIKRNAITGALLHVDFYQVKKTERMRAEVPVIFVGEAPALKLKGRTLIHGISTLTVECLPDCLPTQIQVDLSRLTEADPAIYVKDLAISPEVTLISAPDQMVAKVTEAYVEKEEEKVAVEAEVPAPEEAEAPPEKAAKGAKGVKATEEAAE